jgi:hypothetical protein
LVRTRAAGDDAGLAAGERVLAWATARYTAALGDRLLAAYALGSLAHGGFSEAVSDIDLGLILSDPARQEDAQTISAIAEEVRRDGTPLGSRLSVFWGTQATLRGEMQGGRFPALDRLDLIEHGRLIAGSDEVRRGLPRPTAAELMVAGARFALGRVAGLDSAADGPPRADGQMRSVADPIEEIHSPDLLLAGGVRRVTKAVLFPVRFLFTAVSGRVATNDDAVESYLGESETPSHALVASALAWRAGSPTWEAEAEKLLPLEVIPLYAYYIEDHIARLTNIGEAELAQAFREWRDRLLAPL